jgi:uncharacterized protein (TIGR02246 family)
MTSDEQAIRRLVALWHSATAAGDVDTVLGLMANDVVFLVPGQPPMKGAARSSKVFALSLPGIASNQQVKSKKSKFQEVWHTAGPT